MSKFSQLNEKLATIDIALKEAHETSEKVLTEVTGLRTDFEKLKEQLSDADLPEGADDLLTSISDRLGKLKDSLTAADAVNPDAAQS